MFCGLALDDNDESEKTSTRIGAWVEKLKARLPQLIVSHLISGGKLRMVMQWTSSDSFPLFFWKLETAIDDIQIGRLFRSRLQVALFGLSSVLCFFEFLLRTRPGF